MHLDANEEDVEKFVEGHSKSRAIENFAEMKKTSRSRKERKARM